MEHYTIDKVSWHLGTRNYEFDESIIYQYLENIIKYLERNNLTTSVMLGDDGVVTRDTEIKTSDLTEEGLLLVNVAYDKWIDKVGDGKIAPTDFKLLDKALKKIRDVNL